MVWPRSIGGLAGLLGHARPLWQSCRHSSEKKLFFLSLYIGGTGGGGGKEVGTSILT